VFLDKTLKKHSGQQSLAAFWQPDHGMFQHG
jgi:hypothetical protein